MNQNKEENNKQQYQIIIGLLVALLFVGVLYGIIQMVSASQDRAARIKAANGEMSQILECRGSDSFLATQQNDPWGTPYQTKAVESGEKVVTTYEVYSAGPDKIFGTGDDIHQQNGDLNWTNAGTSVGQRAGRSARGFFKGLWNSGDGK